MSKYLVFTAIFIGVFAQESLGQKKKRLRDFFNFKNLDKIQALFLELIQHQSFEEKQKFLGGLDSDSYDDGTYLQRYDPAQDQTVSESSSSPVGGIDFNPKGITLECKIRPEHIDDNLKKLKSSAYEFYIERD